MMKNNNNLYRACISDIDDGAFRLLVYSYSQNISVGSLNYLKVCELLNISPRTFYRHKRILESKPELFIEPEDLKMSEKVNEFSKQFKEFYENYPRKQARKKAQTSFCNAVKKGTHPYVIINAVKKYALLVEERNTEKRYIPYPSTWLNQERWQDEDLAQAVAPTNQDLAPEVI